MSLAQAATRRTFRSLRVRNYRLFFFGQLVSLTGTWMQQVGQDWLVLRLTNQPLPLGITLALQFAPILVLGAWAGVVADRLDKRRLLLATQIAMASLALVLGVLTATGAIRLWMVYVLALLLGCATAFDMPTRQAFVSEMVGPDGVTNAVGLNSAVFNSARVVGPAVAGLLIAAVGIAPAFLINAVSYLAVIGGLLAMDPARLHRLPQVDRAKGQIRAGLRYVWANPVLRSTIALVAVVGAFGLNYRVALPLLARFTFGGDASAYGALASIMAAGAVVGALAAARRGRPSRALLLG
ncbi:MAG TPA: MFS transporter, partial [Actinomycetota bacterium]|nr:MFS transporter [Actinomycetota bacterium]